MQTEQDQEEGKEEEVSKKKKSKPPLVAQRLNEIDAVNGAAHRGNTVIQRMTAPPETVLEHLKRIGITPIIDQMSLDDGPGKVYVLFGYDDLMKKELDNITSGAAFRDSYPPGTKTKAHAGTPTAPVILDEIRKRMEQATREMTDSTASSEVVADQLQFDGDEDWPITGENPL